MRDSRYELDSEDRIRSVGGAWTSFARANGAEHLEHGILGTPIWDWIAGMDVRHLYRLLFTRVRGTHASVRLPFRCDSPDVRRFMELEVTSLPDDGLLCNARLERSERRPQVSLLEPRAVRSEDLLAICSWCKRVRVSHVCWLEIEDALCALQLLQGAPPAITHTVCPGCAARLDDPD